MDDRSERFLSFARENQQALSDIAHHGCDLAKQAEIEFECEFSSKDGAISTRSRLRDLLKLPPDGLYMIADYTRNGGPCRLLVSVPMVPDCHEITRLELQIRDASAAFGGVLRGWKLDEVQGS